MRRALMLVVLCSLWPWLAGCTALSKQADIRFDADSPIKQTNIGLNHESLDRQIDLEGLLLYELAIYDHRYNVEKNNYSIDDLVALISENGTYNTKIRNDVVSSLIDASTGNCYAYVKSLRAGQVESRLLADFLSGGFATAASVVTPALNSHILGGLSALSTAEGSSFDRNVFAQQAAETIGDAILQLRTKDRTVIEGKMTKSYDAWPLGLALADVLAFHGDCSVARGLVYVQGALQEREATVVAARAAASQALNDPPSAASMLAVVTSLIDPTPAASTPAAPAPAAASASPDWKADLTNLQAAMSKCLDAVTADVQQNPTKTISTSASSAISGVSCGGSKYGGAEMRAAAQAAASSEPDLKLSLDINANNTLVAGAVQNVKQRFVTASTFFIEAAAARRAGLYASLSSWSNGGTGADVVEFIRVFAGLPPNVPACTPPSAPSFSPAIAPCEFGKIDPVIAYAIAGAYLASKDTGANTGKSAALVAMNAEAGSYTLASAP